MRKTYGEQKFKYRGFEVRLWRDLGLGYLKWIGKGKDGNTFVGYDQYGLESYKNAKQHIKKLIIKFIKDGIK